MSGPALLEVEELSVELATPRGLFAAVRGVGWSMGREKLAIVGESGSGKSVTARALLGLLPPTARVQARRLALDGTDLLGLGPRQWRAVRGRRVGLVLQDPRFSLNPVIPVGEQVAEACRIQRRTGRMEARRRAMAMLDAVGIREPDRVFRAFPHQISGGMGQRVMIAIMLVGEPDLLIADEPVSALDAGIADQVLDLLDAAVREQGMGLIFISHDLEQVAERCDRVLVMHGGRIVEALPASGLEQARHPYTRGLLQCRLRDAVRDRDLPVLDRAAIAAAEAAR